MDDPTSERVAGAIEDVVRAFAVPPPRGLPWLALEHASGTGVHLLDALSARGVFRKYELVLDLETSLGGTSRWLAQRLGCEVVGTTASARAAGAAARLTRRARLGAHARTLAAAAESLALRAGRFTHVWVIESLPRLAAPERALAEAHRVLRRGGLIAVQDLVVADGEAPPAVAGWRFATAAERTRALATVGFVDVALHDRTAEAGERVAAVLAARQRLADRLADAAPTVAAERAALAAALARGTLRVVHLLARRA